MEVMGEVTGDEVLFPEASQHLDAVVSTAQVDDVSAVHRFVRQICSTLNEHSHDVEAAGVNDCELQKGIYADLVLNWEPSG